MHCPSEHSQYRSTALENSLINVAGTVSQIKDDVKYGMIEAISHLIHRDYEAIARDFVTLDFIAPEVDLQPILPVLARVFDSALEGGGAKNFNFQARLPRLPALLCALPRTATDCSCPRTASAHASNHTFQSSTVLHDGG